MQHWKHNIVSQAKWKYFQRWTTLFSSQVMGANSGIGRHIKVQHLLALFLLLFLFYCQWSPCIQLVLTIFNLFSLSPHCSSCIFHINLVFPSFSLSSFLLSDFPVFSVYSTCSLCLTFFFSISLVFYTFLPFSLPSFPSPYLSFF